MLYPTPDLYDRYTIELLKRDRASAKNETHLISLSEAIQERGWHDDLIDKLYLVNSQIWDLEAAIRQGKEGELGLEEVGRRALQIRDLNGIRIIIKNEVAKRFGEFGEKKYNHASE